MVSSQVKQLNIMKTHLQFPALASLVKYLFKVPPALSEGWPDTNPNQNSIVRGEGKFPEFF